MHKLSKTLTDIKGIRVGHAENKKAITGVTVIRFPKDGAAASYSCQGGAPGTKETDLLQPGRLVEKIHAISLSGGSAYGLDTACGVMKRLEHEGVGYKKYGVVIPVVPAAVIYDLEIGNPRIRPDAKMGYKACRNASSKFVKQGNVGAGLGATVGKMRGMKYAMKGGLGSHSVKLKKGIVASGLVVVNSLGNVVDPKTRKILAGARSNKNGEFADAMGTYNELKQKMGFNSGNTIIGIVATNAKYSKAELKRLAEYSFRGLRKVINPFCTPFDGDTIFSVSVSKSSVRYRPSLQMMGRAMADVLAQAVLNAVMYAKPAGNISALSSLHSA